MKKAFVLILAMLLTVTWWGGSAAEEKQTKFQSGDYIYVLLEDGTAEITRYRGEASSLSIPSKLDGYTITSIGDSAFSLCESLSSLVIPDSVTSIGRSVFWGCGNLISITIPDSVTSIGDSAFYYCKSLSSMMIPDSVTSIGDSAFSLCESLSSLVIPDSVTSIGDSAFSECESLSSITIPDSVTSIGDSAFYYCKSLTSVTIPDSVTNIGDYAFYGCESLSSLTIGNSVTSIGDYAFSGCESLWSVTIPTSVTSIGKWAFFGCVSLTSVTIPDSVTSIGDEAFSVYRRLTLTVGRASYAKEYAIRNSISYDYPDGSASVLKNIVESMRSGSAMHRMSDNTETDAFEYVDKETRLRFVLPKNWAEKPFYEARNFLDVKFVSLDDPLCMIIYGSFDAYTSLTIVEQILTKRSEYTIFDYSKADIADSLAIQESDITVIDFGGKDFFMATSTISEEMYDIVVETEITTALTIDQGYMYMFQFYGNRDEPYFRDFLWILENVSY